MEIFIACNTFSHAAHHNSVYHNSVSILIKTNVTFNIKCCIARLVAIMHVRVHVAGNYELAIGRAGLEKWQTWSEMHTCQPCQISYCLIFFLDLICRGAVINLPILVSFIVVLELHPSHAMYV